MKGVFSILAFLLVAAGMAFSLFGIPLLVLWVACIFIGAAGRAAKVEAKLNSVLMADEQVTVSALQKRILAIFNRRVLIAITNSRVITIRRGLLGGFKMSDIQWKDLLDATISENVLTSLCGSNLKFRLADNPLLAIPVNGVPQDEAARIYSAAQHHEQSWEEKRRVRAMEELRAAAGGVTVNTQSQDGGDGFVEKIQQAKALFDTGAISDAEFQEMKAKILAG